MTIFTLDPSTSLPLTDQIIVAVKKMVDERVIRIGSRMPSIRKFAQDYYVSRSTVVQAYDRLVAMGYLHSRLGSGFYVSNRPSGQTSQDLTYQLEGTTDVVWLLRKSLEDRSNKTMPGAWWLPASWMEESGIKKSLRTLSLKEGEFLTAYGTSAGYLPLRELLQNKLSNIGIAAETSQVILTNGVTHALDLVTRFLIRAGDAVLVDDPGYFILFGGLKSFGANVIGVPWNHDGPDTEFTIQQVRAFLNRSHIEYCNSQKNII
jgi:DNA-binding transcriptional MocR family regulator